MSQIIKKFIGNDQVDGTKIKLANNQALRARNAANSADVDVLKLDGSDVIQMVGAVNASGAITGSNLSGTNSGNVTLAAVGAVPNANGASLTGQVLNLQPFDGTNPGVVPASGGGTTNFLRADGTWAAAGGSGANQSLSNLTNPTAINQDLIFNKASALVKTQDKTSTTNSEAISVKSGDVVDGTAGDVTIDSGVATGTGASGNVYLGGDAGQIIVGSSLASSPPNGISLGDGVNFFGGMYSSSINLVDSASPFNTIQITTPALASPYGVIMPAAQGTGALSNDGAGNLSWVPNSAPINQKDLFTLSAGDITNQYIDLSYEALIDSIDFLVKGGGIMIQGASYDYSVSYTGGVAGVTRITFLNDLATGGASALIAGDVIVAKYQR
jgi:hypothetical protein